MSHPTTMFIKPAPDLHAEIDPVTGTRPCLRIPIPGTPDYLPPSGLLMPRSGYWLRRLKDGDVVVASAPEGGAATSNPAFAQSDA